MVKVLDFSLSSIGGILGDADQLARKTMGIPEEGLRASFGLPTYRMPFPGEVMGLVRTALHDRFESGAAAVFSHAKDIATGPLAKPVKTTGQFAYQAARSAYEGLVSTASGVQDWRYDPHLSPLGARNGEAPVPIEIRGNASDSILKRLAETVSHNLSGDLIPEYAAFSNFIERVIVHENGDVELKIAGTTDAERNASWGKLFEGLFTCLKYSVPVKKFIDEGREDIFDQMAALWGAHNALMMRTPSILIKNGQVFLDDRQASIASTHGSMMEWSIQFLIAHLFGHSAEFVIRSEFVSNPGYNLFLGDTIDRSERHILIDRDNPALARQQFEQARERNRRYTTIGFPDGTRMYSRKAEDGSRICGDPFAKKGQPKTGVFEDIVAKRDLMILMHMDGINQAFPPEGQMTAPETGHPIVIILDSYDHHLSISEHQYGEAKPQIVQDLREAYEAFVRRVSLQPVLSKEDADDVTRKNRIQRAVKTLTKNSLRKFEYKFVQTLAEAVLDGDFEVDGVNYSEKAAHALDKFLLRIAEAIYLKKQGRFIEMNEWLQFYNVDQAEFAKLFDDECLEESMAKAVKKFKKNYQNPISASLSGGLEAVVPGSLGHTSSERILIGAAHVAGGVYHLIRDIPRIADELNSTRLLDDQVSDSAVNRFLKRGGRFVATRFSDRQLVDTSNFTPNEKTVVTDEQRLSPLADSDASEDLNAILDAWKSLPKGALPDVVEQELKRRYEKFPGLYEQARSYALAYFTSAIDAFLELQDIKEKTGEDFPEELQTAIDELAAVQETVVWRGESISPLALWKMMDLVDLNAWNGETESRSVKNVYRAIRELHRVKLKGRQRGQSDKDFANLLAELRLGVSNALQDSFKEFGLGFSHHTYAQVPESGTTMPRAVLQYILKPFEDDYAGDVEAILDAHNDLERAEDRMKALLSEQGRTTSNDETKKRLKALDKIFRDDMNHFLDKADNIIRFWQRSTRYHAAREMLAKDETGLLREVFVRAFGNDVLSTEIKSEEDAKSPKRIFAEALVALDQDEQGSLARVQSAAYDLLSADDGFVLVDELLRLIDDSPFDRIENEEWIHAYQSFWSLNRHHADGLKAARRQHAKENLVFHGDVRDSSLRLFEQELDFNIGLAEHLMNEISADLQKPAIRRRYRTQLTAIENAMRKLPQAKKKLQMVAERVQEAEQQIMNEEESRYFPNDRAEVALNRPMEELVVLRNTIFNNVVKVWSSVTGEETPVILDFATKAISDKITPKNEMSHHFDSGRGIAGFLGSHTIVTISQFAAKMKQGAAREELTQTMMKWPKGISELFHFVQIDDDRPLLRLNGITSVADVKHTDGWFMDYNGSLIFSYEGRSYLLIAKADLGDHLRREMVDGISILAKTLKEHPYQRFVEWEIARALNYGEKMEMKWGTIAYLGLRNTIMYGGLTMNVLSSILNPINLRDPSQVFSSRFSTGQDAYGIGRSAQVLFLGAGIMGSLNGLSYDIIGSAAQQAQNPKPNKHLVIRPNRDGVMVARSLNILGLPNYAMPTHDRHVAESYVQLLKHHLGVIGALQRIRALNAELPSLSEAVRSSLPNPRDQEVAHVYRTHSQSGNDNGMPANV